MLNPSPLTPPEPRNTTVTLLYVEDEPAIRTTVETMLRRRYERVYCASNGSEGLELYHAHHPDIIITDIQMPVMNGLEMLRRIRENDDLTPVIITSAHNQPHFLIEAIESKADAFIPKPVQKELLLGKIEQFSRKAEQRLFTQVFMQIAHQISKGFLLVGSERNIIFANAAVLEMTGCTFPDVSARPFVNDGEITFPIQITSENWEYIMGGGEYADTVQRQDRSGRSHWFKRTVSPIRNPFGRITHCMMLIDDVTDEHDKVCELEEAAFYDSLTGALRRGTFERRIAPLKQKGNIHFAMLDIDHFKHINDTYGHHSGDEVLKKFAAVVMTQLRSEDLFFRWGGEEFLLAFVDQTPGNVYGILERILRSVAAADFGIGAPVTISIGIAGQCPHEQCFEAIKRADNALYRAKNEGRNCIRKAEPC